MKKFVTILFLLSTFLFGQKTIDGLATDWTGIAPTILHSTAVSANEYIYLGEAGDTRTDQHGGDNQGDYNNDIIEFRFTRDNTNIYFLVKLRDIIDVNRPNIVITLDNNQVDDSPSWFGADSPVNLNPSSNRGWERHIVLHATTTGNMNIEIFADNGSSWYAPPSSYSVVAHSENNIIEAKIALADLSISTNSIIQLNLGTFNNIVNWNNSNNTTTGSYIDVITPNFNGSNNAWFRAGGTGNFNINTNINQDLAPLPVELSSFIGFVNGKSVNLAWKTLTEINSYVFEVERKSISDWTKIGEVKASMNSNSTKSYSFQDNTVNSGKYSYRLKMIDNDGTYEYSDEVEVNLSKPSVFNLEQNFPNPFNPLTNISYNLPVDSKVILAIFNIQGEKVAEVVNEFQTAGNYTIPFDGSHLANGMYIYKLTANDFVKTNKMILLK